MKSVKSMFNPNLEWEGVDFPLILKSIKVENSEFQLNKLEYLPEKEYDTLITNEVALLTKKLSGFEGGEIIINKLKGAFRKGSDEKINFFLSVLGLK
ncbi:hypothetical protein FYC62_06885 [Pedobacter aquae]|uniref:Uncharacterized protein n=1 Tax=Pedobacter aquae TaxID=2605747 RepID=A0A5C0VIA4_9SPHI|nr:hypothetical protein [Pedobacter aquae]QEK51421.1 hypothetical protein FYC62_06885 [Pedobacter aquae]